MAASRRPMEAELGRAVASETSGARMQRSRVLCWFAHSAVDDVGFRVRNALALSKRGGYGGRIELRRQCEEDTTRTGDPFDPRAGHGGGKVGRSLSARGLVGVDGRVELYDDAPSSAVFFLFGWLVR